MSRGDAIAEADYVPLPSLDGVVEYAYGPLSSEMDGVVPGATIELELSTSSTYPGTTRRVWLHLPANADRTVAANLCVFQDGWLYLDPDGPIRAGVVLDNLHASGLIAPTVGVFVEPGAVESRLTHGAKQRNAEYDPFTPRYGAFLRDEVLPMVERHVAIDRSRSGNIICGGSSGGNCAFAAAWFHPELFEVAICFVSSFAQIPGGNSVPALLNAASPTAEKMRVFQQIALRDLNWDQPENNWVAENFKVAAALLERGDDLRCVVGDGGHSPNHGGVLLPDALVWATKTRNP